MSPTGYHVKLSTQLQTCHAGPTSYSQNSEVPMEWIVSLHSKTLPSHNPRAKDGLQAVYVRTCHVFTSGSGVVHGWSRSGTGMERYGTGSGTKRPTPAQHCHHAAHLYQNSQFGARIAQQFLDCQLAAAKRISTIKHHSCATACSNFKWCRHKPATG